MRKLDLSEYPVEVGEQTLPYSVKESLSNLLYSSDLKRNFKDLLDNDRVAQKINKSGDYVLLEEEEYGRVKCAVENFKGYSRNDVILVQRVLDAPTYEVK
jgi:hypothetical protein